MPQAKRTAVIRLDRDKLVAELPFQVCSSRVGEVRCPRDKLVEQMKQLGIDNPSLEQGLCEVLDELEDYTDNTVLATFSIILPYKACTPATKRTAAAATLKKALNQCGFSVSVEGSDTMVIHEVAAA